MKKVVLCSFMCIMFSACQHAVKSNRELFDEQYEKIEVLCEGYD